MSHPGRVISHRLSPHCSHDGRQRIDTFKNSKSATQNKLNQHMAKHSVNHPAIGEPVYLRAGLFLPASVTHKGTNYHFLAKTDFGAHPPKLWERIILPPDILHNPSALVMLKAFLLCRPQVPRRIKTISNEHSQFFISRMALSVTCTLFNL